MEHDEHSNDQLSRKNMEENCGVSLGRDRGEIYSDMSLWDQNLEVGLQKTQEACRMWMAASEMGAGQGTGCPATLTPLLTQCSHQGRGPPVPRESDSLWNHCEMFYW